jgi:hypothetical protein
MAAPPVEAGAPLDPEPVAEAMADEAPEASEPVTLLSSEDRLARALEAAEAALEATEAAEDSMEEAAEAAEPVAEAMADPALEAASPPVVVVARVV